MTIDQLEAIGEEIAWAVKAKYTLDYARFDAGVGQFEQAIPWATLFVSKRGYENRTNPEFPLNNVQKWLAMTEEQAREAMRVSFEIRAKGLVPPVPEAVQTEPRKTLQPTG
jgi:hypothetical protein